MQGAKVKVMDQLDSDVHPELETVDSAGRVPSASSLTSETYATSLDDDAANAVMAEAEFLSALIWACLLYTSPSPRDRQKSRMPSSA